MLGEKKSISRPSFFPKRRIDLSSSGLGKPTSRRARLSHLKGNLIFQKTSCAATVICQIL